MTDPKLIVNNLSVRSKSTGTEILKNLCFELPEGQITGIVGESGSGKSVTALSIMGLLPNALEIEKGELIYFNRQKPEGQNILQKGEREKLRGQKIAMIFQEPMTSLNPSMLCGLQLEETLKIHSSLNKNERKDKIHNLLRKVKLLNPGKIYHSYPHQLSGGQRQRIMIAMALSNNPDILIADEPTTALDVTVQKEIILLLKDLREEYNLTVIFISHDLRLLSEIAHHLIVMRFGKVVEKGNVEDILQNPKENYTKALLACQPKPGDRVRNLLTVEDFESDIKPEIHFREKKIYTEILFSVTNLNLFYRATSWSKNKDFQALKNIGFRVFKGETLGIVGESGSGKTSLGKTMLGLISSGQGDILFKGRNLQKMTKKEKRRIRKDIQVVFQDPYSSLNPLYKVKQILMEARSIHFPREKKSESLVYIKQLIIQTGLKKEDLDKYPHEFSGGQRQRISIARALAVEPEFIILDESVSALDVSIQAQVLNLLNKLKREYSLTYLFISHDLAVVNFMSDRIIVMKDGEIAESGDSDDIYSNPKSEYTKTLIDSIPGKKYWN